jgi:hypothetical protein
MFTLAQLSGKTMSAAIPLLPCSQQAQDLKIEMYSFLVFKTNIAIRTALNLCGYDMQYPATAVLIFEF